MKNYIIILILSIFAISCSKKQSKSLKPIINGRAGEVLVVMEESIKKDTAGKTILHLLNQPYLGLPQDEPVFDYLTTPPQYFTSQLKQFRNIIIVEKDPQASHDTINFTESFWAREQALVKITARSEKAIQEIAHRNEIKIISFFNRAERNRIITFNKSTNYSTLTSEIRDQWGISIVIPTGYNKNKSSNNFTWISQETPTTSQGLMIYGFKHVGEGTFSKEFLLNKRDSLLRYNIEGPVPGSFMKTELKADLIYKAETVNGTEVAEIRGLWKTEGYAMGGPFILRAYYNKETGNVVVTDGYVYFPDKPEKRNMIRQLEAIEHTVSF
jgi:hypothetical protein